MVGTEGDDRIVKRGIDEAFACQDLLARAPVRPSLPGRAVAWIAAFFRALPLRAVVHKRPAPPVVPTQIP